MNNYSKGIPYHSQRNNEVIPFSSCNSTSMIMALKQAGYDCNFGEGQPEDILTTLLLTEKYWQMMDSLNPRLRGQDYRPNEIHGCLSAAANELLGDSIVKFSTTTPINKIKDCLVDGGGAVLSGRFKLSNGKTLNHIVSLAGFGSNGYIIDDPFGNWKTDYIDHRGNDIMLTNDEFLTVFKGTYASKWAHLIKRAVR